MQQQPNLTRSAHQIVDNVIPVSITLLTLKEGRFGLIEDFLSNNPDIYEPAYKHEKSKVQMQLAREKFFLSWLARHWQLFCNIVESYPKAERAAAERVFSNAFLNLTNNWIEMAKQKSSYSFEKSSLSLGLYLINEMQDALKKIIMVGENSDIMRSKLQVSMEKNKRLFEREIGKFSEGSL